MVDISVKESLAVPTLLAGGHGGHRSSYQSQDRRLGSLVFMPYISTWMAGPS
jgi:hypothetical protein